MTQPAPTLAPTSAQPSDGILGHQTMRDGQRLMTRTWPAADALRSVLIVHGLGEHSGRYAALAQWFLERGYAVRSYDQRGHGQSPGQRGALRGADDLLDDLAEVFDEYAGGRAVAPLLLGHSMGGLVAARAVLDRRIEPSGMVLSSPAMRSRGRAAMQTLAGMLAKWAPRLPLRNGLKTDRLSHDSAVIAAYRNDPLCSSSVTPRLADFIFRAGPATIDDASRLDLPTLLLVADSDALVDPAGSREFARRAAATGQLTVRFFATLYHELFNEAEPGRSQVLMQLGDWLRGRHDERSAA